MKNKTFIYLAILAICAFCFAACGRNNAEGSVPNGTNNSSGSVSDNKSNDTVNSNNGSADGGKGNTERNSAGTDDDISLDGAAGKAADAAKDMYNDVTDGIRDGINDMTDSSAAAGTNSIPGNTGTASGTVGAY